MKGRGRSERLQSSSLVEEDTLLELRLRITSATGWRHSGFEKSRDRR